MNTSESITKIAAALLAAQKAITFAAKDSVNPHFRSTYADLESVINAVKGPLNDQSIVFIQMPAPSDSGSLALTTRLLHESGEWIESTATCPLQKFDPQGYGSAITYLKRYSLASVLGLYQADDDGNAAQTPPASKKAPVTPAAGGIGDDLPEDEKKFIAEGALWANSIFKTQGIVPIDAWIKEQKLENDQRIYLERFLDSSVRSALKTHAKHPQ